MNAMFDRTIIVPGRTRTEYVTREVHEHRAPTDESVKLLREMEQKARDQVIDAVHVGDAHFECVIHTMNHVLDGSTEMLAVFSMNGKKMTVSHRDQMWRSDRVQMVAALRDEMAKEIATVILLPALQNFR
jgi:hypothetical protein